MEEKENPTPEAKPEETLLNRLKALAEKSKKSVEEILDELEKKQEVLDRIASADNRSIGSQSKNSENFCDPASAEFLKGIWGK